MHFLHLAVGLATLLSVLMEWSSSRSSAFSQRPKVKKTNLEKKKSPRSHRSILGHGDVRVPWKVVGSEIAWNPSLLSVFAIKQCGEERVYMASVFRFQPSIKGRNSRQELRQRPQRNTAYWLTGDLLSLLFYITQEGLPKDGTVLTGLCLFTQSLTKKMSPKTYPQDSLVEDIPPLKIPLPR